ncbi:MAG: urea ABC transporter ATP-binding subunit UrtE [Verrucomicrobiales bacterium]|nr:urea ABC transporter ATP-binding subunit UrtE [Verrucomicrobiales bacterium]
MLSCSNIHFAYGSVQVLHDVSIEVPKAKVVCVMGRNGVGKTTLMRNIVGLEKASKGRVTLDGRNISKQPARKRAQSGLALVPQGRMIFPRLSVRENLEVGLSARTDGRRTIPEEIYELFPVLHEMGERQGGNLSGGQQQQLAIGRALVGEPRVLLLDEPTEGIQPNVIQAIGQVLRRLVSEKEMTVVLVEQYVDFIKEFGDHYYIMNRGRVVANGDTPQLSESIVRQHLGV